MALKKTSITISPAMTKDSERNAFQSNRSARINDVFERYHAIVDATDYPEVLDDAEYELMAELIEQGLEHHPALPLHRAVARLLEDRKLDGEDVRVDPDAMCQKLEQLTRGQEMAFVEFLESKAALRRDNGLTDDPVTKAPGPK
ncbi:hypothetical protein [Ruegeria arenilitoris]|uniref:hypothetical protein n=1 Tax=Ruegeria arenilitoris TaxID=1173585 RepID=UPI00147C0F35|nr:hypothetical protein [Ruegeria arenilitoris]